MIIKAVLRFLSILLPLFLSIWSQSIGLMLLTFALAIIFWQPNIQTWLINKLNQRTRWQRRFLEWSMAILTASIVVVFVFTNLIGIYKLHSSSMRPALNSGETLLISKLHYGAAKQINETYNYHRLEGLNSFKQNDIIAFYFPEADTAFKNHPRENYYYLKRQQQRSGTKQKLPGSKVVHLPVEQRPVFIKRLIGLPGQTLQIINGNYQINGETTTVNQYLISKYQLNKHTKASVRQKILGQSLQSYREDNLQFIETSEQMVIHKDWTNQCEKVEDVMNMPDTNVFPFEPGYFWNTSFMGPITIPQKGQTIKLNFKQLPLYRRIIENYEDHQISIRNNQIFLDGKLCNTYTFQMNYFWVGGDNRHHSFDSRYWGFVPENHIIGKVIYPNTDKIE